MTDIGGNNNKNVRPPPVCSCPDWEQTGSQGNTLSKPDGYNDRNLVFECLPNVSVLSDGYGTHDRPQSRMGTLERPNSRSSSGVSFDRSTNRGTVTYERPVSRNFDRPNSRVGNHYERPVTTCGSNNSPGGVYNNDNRMISAVIIDRPSCTTNRCDDNLTEIRNNNPLPQHNPNGNRDFDGVVGQVHSLCCAEWENGLRPQSEWNIDLDIRQHIQQCTCTCNHMGYGNYMDYQVRSISHHFFFF